MIFKCNDRMNSGSAAKLACVIHPPTRSRTCQGSLLSKPSARANCGNIPPHWQPSREAQEPLPRTIKGLREGAGGKTGEGRGRRRDSCACVARPALRTIPSPAAERNVRVRRPIDPRNIPRAFESSWRSRVRARHRSGSSFVREARVAGRWLGLYSVVVRYCTSPGLSKRARPLLGPSIRGARDPVSRPARRSFTAVATHRTWFGVNLVLVYQIAPIPACLWPLLRRVVCENPSSHYPHNFKFNEIGRSAFWSDNYPSLTLLLCILRCIRGMTSVSCVKAVVSD